MEIDPECVKPLGALVLVRVFKERKTRGGIFVPETAKLYGQNTAKVVAVGPGDMLQDAGTGSNHWRKADLEPGDVVLLRYQREEIRLPGQPGEDDEADSYVALVDPSVCIAKLDGWRAGDVAA